ncbi:hypothetical protein HHK36_017875 [Tetracentron sinense]|uniref:Uncharacterized protein n=1 Tax=Tetracentron sinense TaxID=13715 RepID=A0A834YXJ8_TETSI|nr:hypothetical protein HHK36_017875 [Tetracentron sinense]
MELKRCCSNLAIWMLKRECKLGSVAESGCCRECDAEGWIGLCFGKIMKKGVPYQLDVPKLRAIGILSITKDRWDFSITWNIQRWSGLLAFYCFRESEQINVGNVWIVGSDGSEEEEQEAFVERIESKNEYFETAEFHLVSVEEYLIG